MFFQNKSLCVLWTLLVAAVFLLAWKIQVSLFLNYDVSWLMHAVRRMLAGGTYAQHFFETNPPLILYLYLPPVILSKMLTYSIISLFRGYLFLLASLSLVLCYCLLRKIFKREHATLAALFFLMLACLFLILPCCEFGQREHLLLILTMPYFLLLTCRLQGVSIHPAFALALGFLAGLGFAIKPHFLIPLLLLEVYYAVHEKKGSAWRRPESVMLLVTMAVYGISIFLFYPDYVYIVVPYSWRLYYGAVSHSWFVLLFNGLAVYCALPLLFYLIPDKEQPYPFLNTVLFLALLGFLLAYLLQRMVIYYHFIPALAFALLLLLMKVGPILARLPRRWPDSVFAIPLLVLLCSPPAWIFYNIYAVSLSYKKQVLAKLVAFMEEHAKQDSVYFFVTTGSYTFPTVEYTSTTIAPRFYFLWMVAGLANQMQAEGTALVQQKRDKNFLINMIADDLHQYKPRYVFVDQGEDKYRIKAKNFDYLTYFADNAKFRAEWNNYHYFTTLEEKGLYRLGVYSR